MRPNQYSSEKRRKELEKKKKKEEKKLRHAELKNRPESEGATIDGQDESNPDDMLEGENNPDLDKASNEDNKP